MKGRHMLTSYHSPLNALHVQLLRNAKVISICLVIINVRFKYQTYFYLLKPPKEIQGHILYFPSRFVFQSMSCLFDAVNTVCFWTPRIDLRTYSQGRQHQHCNCRSFYSHNCKQNSINV
jgi:hypothetical protein